MGGRFQLEAALDQQGRNFKFQISNFRFQISEVRHRGEFSTPRLFDFRISQLSTLDFATLDSATLNSGLSGSRLINSWISALLNS